MLNVFRRLTFVINGSSGQTTPTSALSDDTKSDIGEGSSASSPCDSVNPLYEQASQDVFIRQRSALSMQGNENNYFTPIAPTPSFDSSMPVYSKKIRPHLSQKHSGGLTFSTTATALSSGSRSPFGSDFSLCNRVALSDPLPQPVRPVSTQHLDLKQQNSYRKEKEKEKDPQKLLADKTILLERQLKILKNVTHIDKNSLSFLTLRALSEYDSINQKKYLDDLSQLEKIIERYNKHTCDRLEQACQTALEKKQVKLSLILDAASTQSKT